MSYLIGEPFLMFHDIKYWFLSNNKSYFTTRTEICPLEILDHFHSKRVPQRSNIRPVLFILYLLPLWPLSIVVESPSNFNCVSKQLLDPPHSSVPPSSTSQSPIQLTVCQMYMCQNLLQLNAFKTEAIMVDIPHQIQSSPSHLSWQSVSNIRVSNWQQNLCYQLKYKSRSVIWLLVVHCEWVSHYKDFFPLSLLLISVALTWCLENTSPALEIFLRLDLISYSSTCCMWRCS